MSKELRFDDKVAIVTGAGGGLGRSHALLLASRGAKVVVNDLGGTFTGEGKSSSAADKVVAEITSAGGTAVANYDSVEDGDRIVKTALDAFGRVDIVINNAGILRDVSFAKMSQADWDLVYKVHVLGAFRVTQAAWPHLRDQGYGRVIFTASAAGIYGNFGQTNYAMAKLGVFGFAQSLAIEGRKRNVLVNTIAPIAGSRMTETVLPPQLIETLRPEFVSPLVARLCHQDSVETGSLFEVGGGFFAKLRWERALGKTYRIGRSISVEDIDRAWGTITSFEESTHPDSVAASMQPIMENLQKGPGDDAEEEPSAAARESPKVASGSAGSRSPEGPAPTSWDVFIAMRDHVERHLELVSKVACVYLFKLTSPDTAWTLDLKNGKGAVIEGAPEKADCTLEIADADFLDMTSGKANPMSLFSTGKLKISGNVMASQKLDFLSKIDPKQAMEAVARARAAGEKPKATAAVSQAASAKAPAIFTALERRLAERPDLGREVQAVVVFKVTSPDGVWTVDLAAPRPCVEVGARPSVSATLTIADADLHALASGTAAARDLYQHGKLRVDGDVTVAHRLGFLKGLV